MKISKKYILDIIDVIVTSLQFSFSCLLSFLKTGVIYACFNSFVKLTVSIPYRQVQMRIQSDFRNIVLFLK